MAVPEEYVGVKFRHNGPVPIRWCKDGERRMTQESVRPYDEKRGFLDLDNPTLITFAANDKVDVPFLLTVGAIVPHGVMAARKVAAIEKEEQAAAARE